MIRRDHPSQAQINGFRPTVLKNTKLNACRPVFKGCVRDTVPKPLPRSPEFVLWELYVRLRCLATAFVEGTFCPQLTLK